MVRCLERATGAQQDLHEALRGCSGGDGGGAGGSGRGLAAWRVLLRQLRAAAASASREAGVGAPSRAGTAPGEGGREGGGGRGARVGHLGVHARERGMSSAARVLLGELEPLERLEVRAQGAQSRLVRWGGAHESCCGCSFLNSLHRYLGRGNQCGVLALLPTCTYWAEFGLSLRFFFLSSGGSHRRASSQYIRRIPLYLLRR